MKFLIVILLILAIKLSAESSSTVRYLMNEPVSMLDMGLYKIENYLNTQGLAGHFGGTLRTVRRPIASVTYNYKKNIINVYHSVVVSELATKELCKNVWKATRLAVYLSLPKVFSHNGYIMNTEPQHMYEDIENIIYIDVFLEGSEKSMLNCEGEYSNEKVLYSN